METEVIIHTDLILSVNSTSTSLRPEMTSASNFDTTLSNSASLSLRNLPTEIYHENNIFDLTNYFLKIYIIMETEVNIIFKPFT